MQSDRLYISFDPEIEALLADNFIDLEGALRQAGHDVTLEHTSRPGGRAASAGKEPATILVATAAVILAATPVIREIIQSVSRRPVVLKQRRLIPVEDSKGNVVLGTDGQVVLQWVEAADVKALPTTSTDEQNVDVKGPLGIHISYASKPLAKSD
jgi:hypothetical protein